MKRCARFAQQIDDYVTGRCDPGVVRWMTEHASVCAPCRREEAAAREMRSVMRGAIERVQGETPGHPEEFLSTLHARIRDREAERERSRRALPWTRNGFLTLFPQPPRLVPWGAAAGVALLAALGLAISRWDQGRSGSPAPAPIAIMPKHDSTPPNRVPVPHQPDGGRGSRLVEIPRPGQDRWEQPLLLPGPVVVKGADRTGLAVVTDPGPAVLPHGDRSDPSYPSDDLKYLNDDTLDPQRRWAPMPRDEWAKLEKRVRENVKVKDDFVQIPFPRLVDATGDQIAAAVESYKREAAIIDPRLFREVTLQQKATPLSDLCDRLRADSSISLVAGRSVADEKVTLLCSKTPLREVMRQLSRPFGYTWVRSKKENEYRYELVQDLKSQLQEEALRQRDRNQALIALEQDLERYRPYLHLSPDEALARARSAAPGDRKRLEKYAKYGWGPIQMYFRLSPRDLAALRDGQKLTFSAEPGSGEQPLPRDLERGVLQSQPTHRLVKAADGSYDSRSVADAPDGLPVHAVPEMRAQVSLEMPQSELGQFTLGGASGFFGGGLSNWADIGSPWAVGMSPAVLKPDNAVVNARLATEPAMRRRVTVQPQPSCRPMSADGSTPEHKVNSADVLEALHRASGMPVVADYFTRLYGPGSATVRSRPLFDALNQLCETMRLRWDKEGNWLQFRSTSFYNDRLKEVPQRLLTRWQASRRQHGALTVDDLIEIAQLSDAQLDAADMAEGARECFGLKEWDLARNKSRRPHLRFLAQLTPPQRQEAASPTGLEFTKMSLAQQQRFIALAFPGDDNPLQSLDELTGATLRVDYTQPGSFQWRVPGPYWLRWIAPLERNKRMLRPPVRAQTREAALQALRKVDAKVREAVWQAARRADPRAESLAADEEAQIVPTELDLSIIYMPDSANKRDVHAVWGISDSTWTTW